jgi:DNA-binding NarL/FixJ family response regulator
MTSTSTSTRIFIVDDHPLVREWLGNLLRMEPDLSVIGEADNTATAIAAMVAHPPDVAIIDLTLNHGSGLDLIKDVRARLPSVEIVVLSMHEELTDLERAFRAGASGYVMKRESTGQIVEAIRQVRAGRVFANPTMLAQLTARVIGRGVRADAAPGDVLSDRELEVFRRIGAGQSTRDISDHLGVSLKTIQTYCARIKQKLGLDDGQELSRLAYRWHEQRTRGTP